MYNVKIHTILPAHFFKCYR